MSLLIADHKKHWPGGCVVWEFGPGLLDTEKNRYIDIMAEWSEKANVRFLEKTVQHSHVKLRSDNSIDGVSHSSVGMQGGEQSIYLEPLTDENHRKHTARHEIGHTIGLHHEHMRCDRDNFLKISSKIKLERLGDYYPKLCGNDVKTSGSYDFRSVMHYNPLNKSTTDGSVDLQGSSVENQALLDDSGARHNISVGDADAVNMLHGGNSHIYQLSGDGQIEKTIQQYNWSAGWSIAHHFAIDIRNFLILLKQSDGTMHLHDVNFDGTIGNRLTTKDWSSGWTSAIKYTILLGNYLLLYKKGNGTLHINNINFDGSIGNITTETTIESGWSTVRHYAIGVDNFLLLFNADTGIWRIRKINWNGTVGESIQSGDWTSGWTCVEPYIAGGKHYLLCLKTSDGSMKIKRIGNDGKIESNETDVRDWSSGWTNAVPYEINGSTYLMLLKSTSGRLDICQLLPNGKVGTTTDRREFGPGWTVTTIYHSGPWTHALFIKT